MAMARSVWIYELNAAMTADVIAVVLRLGGAKNGPVHVAPLNFGPGFDTTQCGCVISALMGATSAELPNRLAQLYSPLAVVYLAEQPTTKTIVDVIRSGAFDVLDWPGELDRLGVVIQRALKASVDNKRCLEDVRSTRQRLAELAAGELDVLKMLLDGNVNRTIAKRLGIAIRTVEARRKRLFEKLGSHNVAEIAGMLNRTGLLRPSALPVAPTDTAD